MIINCTPPYGRYIPNPALGYLKGFLESEGINVKAVYWNVILARKMLEFQSGLEEYEKDERYFSVLTTLYLGRQLLTDSLPRVTPLHLLYSSVYTREELSEIVHSIKDDIFHYIKQHNLHEALLAGFTLKTYQWIMGYYLMSCLKEMNPEIKIVTGGITNESQARAFMNMFSLADFAVYGEGEYPLLHLAKALKEDVPITKVPQLVYRDDNKIVSTGALYECPHLDVYPFADHSDYFQTFKKYMVFVQFPVSIPVWGSRSCPWNKCKFCVLNEEYPYRARSPENIVQEIEYQSEQYNVDNFIFVDTELPGNKKRFKTLLKLLVKSSSARKKKYYFQAEVSPVFIDAETAHLMQLASFNKIQIGFEAVTDTLLEKMRKRHGVAHNIQALKLGRKHSLAMQSLNIIREIPTETSDDILESCINLKFLRFFLDEYTLIPGFFKLWKGAPFYKEMSHAERELWKENPYWTEIAPLHLVSNRFDFFGFYRSVHDPQWSVFQNLLRVFTCKYSYEWIEYPDGSSVEEKGPITHRYLFDRNETDLLLFCDTIKGFSEVKKRFSHLSEGDLLETMENLKDAGMLYYDKDLHCIISVLEADRRTVLVP